MTGKTSGHLAGETSVPFWFVWSTFLGGYLFAPLLIILSLLTSSALIVRGGIVIISMDDHELFLLVATGSSNSSASYSCLVGVELLLPPLGINRERGFF